MVLIAIICVTLLDAVVVQSPQPTYAAPVPQSVRCPELAQTEVAAAAAAAACRGRVEVGSARSERGQVFANPDGSFTSVQAARVQRIRRADGSWVGPDSTVRQSGAGYAPVAVGLDVTFSAGGDAPLATVRRDGAELTLSWPGVLPKPVAAGSTLTYPEVLPGVDLVVTSDVEGFGQTLVVKNAQAAANAALGTVRLITRSKGLRLKEGSGDSLLVTSAAGRTLFSSGRPMMWDSSGSEPGSPFGPAGGARVAGMGLRVADEEISVDPVSDLLRGSGTRYPVYIDPAVFRTSWTMINNRYPDQSYWAYDRKDCPSPFTGVDCAKVGYTDEATTMAYRSLFQFGTGDYVGKHVLDAKLSIDLLYSWMCSDSATTVHVVNATLDAETDWNNNVGAWGAAIASASNSSCRRVRRSTEWGLTGTVQTAAAQWWGWTTFGLKAATESSHNGWKKFDAGTAYLTVVYNSYPNIPDNVSVNDEACVTGAGRPYIRSLTPVLKARVSDPDGAARALTGTFSWWALDGTQNAADTVAQATVVSGAVAQETIPAGRLLDGKTYAFRAQASDGIDVGQQSGVCEFTVDATPPNPPSAVASTTYPADGALHGGAGSAGSFTFSPPATGVADVVGYAYTLDDAVQPAAATQVTSDTGTHVATVLITPPTDGSKTLRVWSKDIAGNYSLQAVSYAFAVRAGTGPDAVWRFDENTGTAAEDASGHGNTVALTGGAAWTPGRGKASSALLRDGTLGGAATSGPVATMDQSTGAATTLRTDANFTVSAWVRLDSSGGTAHQAIVSQDGSRVSAFCLDYSGPDDRWWFSYAQTDTDDPVLIKAVSDAAPRVGVWTYLVGTYDAATRAVRLYVDGVAQGLTGVGTGPFNATGPLTIGRRMWAGAAAEGFTGAIDDVRIYARVVGTGEAEFTNPLNPVQPTVSFPDGTRGRTGQPLRITIDAGGDPTATSVKYSIGTESLVSAATLPTAGGQVTVTVTPRVSGRQLVFVAAVNTAGRQGETTPGLVGVEDAPALSGVVRGPTGTPVTGATVRLIPANTTVTTGSDGVYVFGGLVDATYTVSATIPTQSCVLYATTAVDIVGASFADLVLGPQSDMFGYTCSTSQRVFQPADQTVLDLHGSQSSREITFPFPVRYYEETLTSAWVSTSGTVSSDDPLVDGGGKIPSIERPNGVIAPFWSSLDVDATSSVRTAVSGTAPNREFIVEWRNVRAAYTYVQDYRVTFEVVFAETGEITFNYTDLDTAAERGAQATVGIESQGGSCGIQYSYEQASLANGTAVTFWYPQVPRPLPNGMISGIVVQDGVPVPNLKVTLLPLNITAVTMPDGWYAFPSLEPGGYSLTTEFGCGRADVVVQMHGDVAPMYEHVEVDLNLKTGPDEFGYWCETVDQPFVPANDTVLPMSDSSTFTVDLPFTFRFYGRNYRQLEFYDWVHGCFLPGQIDETASSAARSDKITARGYIVRGPEPYDSNVSVDSASSVRTATIGTAPNRQFIVEWRDLVLNGDPSFRVSFEVILGEDATVTYNYTGLDNDLERGSQAMVRLNGGWDGNIVYSKDQAVLANNRAIVFHPPTS